MKKMKLGVVIAIATATILTNGISAVQATVRNNASNADPTISVSLETAVDLSSDEKSKIERDVLAYHLYGVELSDEGIAPCGLTCTLFGHDTQMHIAIVVEHKIRKTIPRCLETKYNVTTCSRCDYELIEKVMDHYISCCPED